MQKLEKNMFMWTQYNLKEITRNSMRVKDSKTVTFTAG